MKIYISCGKEPTPEGWERRDLENLNGFIQDAADSIDEYMLVGVYDKVTDPVFLIMSIHTRLKVGGKCTVVCPYWACSEAWLSPLTRRAVSELSLNWTNKGWREQSQWSEQDANLDFEVQTGLTYAPEWNLRSDDAKSQAIGRNVNVAKIIHIVLTKKCPAV